jgi:hypothetical protein
MKRLGNITVSKTEGSTPTIKLMGGTSNTVKFNPIALSKLGLGAGNRIDVLEGDIIGEFFITKTSVEGEGRKVSKLGSINSSSIYSFLNQYGKHFEITDTTMELDGLTWRKLKVISEPKSEVSELETKVITKETVKEKKEPKVVKETVKEDNF